MKNRVWLLVCSLFVAALIGCAKEPVQPRLLESMVEFDRAYIPALMFTDLRRQRESEIAIGRLGRSWREFKHKYYGLELKYGKDITDKFWKEDFDRINGLIVTAESLVGEGKLPAAHKKLAGVRVIFKNLRHRNGVVYFLDGLTGFDNSMAGIILSLRGKNKLRDKDIKELRALFKEAQANWSRAAATPVDQELFGFKDDKIAAIKKRVAEEERLLASLAVALSSRSADRIFQAAQDLKPNFVVLYKAFGDWQPIFDQVVKERKAREAASAE